MKRIPTRQPAAYTDAPPSDQWIFYYDGNCGFCTRVAQGLSLIDFFRQVQWIPFQTLEEPPQGLSWEDLDRAAYLDTRGRGLHEGFYGFRMLTLRLVPLVPLAPVFWFPGMNLLGTKVYRWIARNRYRISRCMMLPLKSRRHREIPGPGEHEVMDYPSEAP